MKYKTIGVFVLLLLLHAGFPMASAQPAAEPSAEPGSNVAPVETSVTLTEEQMALSAAELPLATNRARAAGIAELEVRELLFSMNRHHLEAWEAREVMEVAAESAERNGPCDNFGAFVNARLDEGLRGQELARAIREEHLSRGRGRHGRGLGSGERPGLQHRFPREGNGPGLRPIPGEGSGRGRDRGMRGFPSRDDDRGPGRPDRSRRPNLRRPGVEEGSGGEGRPRRPGGL